MNSTLNGKIARLPKGKREKLNQRLEQPGNGGELVKWLNSQPEGLGMVATVFGGRLVFTWARLHREMGGRAVPTPPHELALVILAGRTSFVDTGRTFDKFVPLIQAAF